MVRGSQLVRGYTAEDEPAIRHLASQLAYWIDMDRRVERDDGTLILPLLHGRRRKRFGISYEKASGESAGRLIVHEVLRVEINDDARIGTYDIDEVSYDPAQRTLTVRSGVPMELTIWVQRPHVRLELD